MYWMYWIGDLYPTFSSSSREDESYQFQSRPPARSLLYTNVLLPPSSHEPDVLVARATSNHIRPRCLNIMQFVLAFQPQPQAHQMDHLVFDHIQRIYRLRVSKTIPVPIDAHSMTSLGRSQGTTLKLTMASSCEHPSSSTPFWLPARIIPIRYDPIRVSV